MNDIIKKCYLQIVDRINLTKHITIALIVGTILNLINQFDPLIHLQFQKIDYIKAVITYIVPFAVSVYSAATISKIER